MFGNVLLTGLILIDLQKAWDIIDHEILLQKLKAMRLSENTIKWLKLYFSERIFLVNIENKLSDYGKTSCGVSQGPILGPLLVLIYVNDMPQALASAFLWYADNSCILYQLRTLRKSKKDLMKTLKFLVTSLLIKNWVFIWVRIR